MLVLALTLALLGVQPPPPPPPEKPVDPLSTRVSITGCLRGRNLVTIEPPEDEPVNVSIAPGRVFRLKGPKDLMKDLKKRDKTVVAVTGLIRRAALDPSRQGVPVAGGRVRIGVVPGTDPSRPNTTRDPFDSMEVMDLESFRPADGTCPSK